jgi:hypothetical protein
MEYRYALAAGLPNKAHSAEVLSPLNDLPVGAEFVTYRPPLRESWGTGWVN